MIDLNRPEIRFALDVVRETSRLVKNVQKNMVTDALTKGDRSPVTVADYAAQALVGKRLMDAFPADPLVGEEDSSRLKTAEEAETLTAITEFVQGVLPGATSDDVCSWIDHGNSEGAPRFWTVDPIDGTKGFLRGDQYAVALALVIDGVVELGVLGCPNLTDGHISDHHGAGSVAIAVRGKGTWIGAVDGSDEFKQVRVSDQGDAGQARLLRSVESGHTNTGQIGQLVDELAIVADPVLMDSQAKYSVLAAGSAEALVRLISSRMPDYKEKIWDQAAGSIVLEEAGGRISDLDGKPLDFGQGRTLANNRGVLASNGTVHEAMLAGLKTVGA